MRIGTLGDGMGVTYTGCLLLSGLSCVGIYKVSIVRFARFAAPLLCWVKSENAVTCVALGALWYTSEVYDNTGVVRSLVFAQCKLTCKSSPHARYSDIVLSDCALASRARQSQTTGDNVLCSTNTNIPSQNLMHRCKIYNQPKCVVCEAYP